MRDQLITLSMRKPSRIKVKHNVPTLALDDFDIELPDDGTIPLPGNRAAWSDVVTRTTLAKICIEKVKLCICIHHILATQYSESIVSMARVNMTPDTLVMLTPKQITADNMEVIYCEQQLDDWNENLPQDCYFREQNTAASGTEDPLSVHRAVLNMLYLTASSALHRPHVVLERPLRRTGLNLQHLSLKRAKEAATKITDIAKSLHNRDLTRFLPPVGVTVLIPAMMMHLMEIKTQSTLDNPSICSFRQCVDVLQILQEIFASADYAYYFVDAAVQKSNIELVRGAERRRVEGIADLMSLQDPLIPQTGADLDVTIPRARLETSRLSHTSVLPYVDFATDSAVAASKPRIENVSPSENTYRIDDAFEAFINFDIFTDSFGAGAGLGVDFNEFWTVS